MKTLNYTLLTAALFFYTLLVNGQDYIRIGRDSIPCKVEEIGLDEIKYKSFDNPDGPLNVIEKRRVTEIVYENGKHEFFYQDEYDANPEIKIRNKTHAVKFEFLSPLNHTLALGYEQVNKIGMNMEFKLGIIGASSMGEDGQDPRGFYLKAGLKFLTSPTYYQKGTKYSHGLKGFYIKPEIIYSSFTIDKKFISYSSTGYGWFGLSNVSYDKTQTVHYGSGAFNMVFGKQHILANLITLDYYLGIGYGFETHPDLKKSGPGNETFNNVFEGKCFSHSISESGFAASAGLTIGVLF
jgi:hypothetical protein